MKLSPCLFTASSCSLLFNSKISQLTLWKLIEKGRFEVKVSFLPLMDFLQSQTIFWKNLWKENEIKILIITILFLAFFCCFFLSKLPWIIFWQFRVEFMAIKGWWQLEMVGMGEWEKSFLSLTLTLENYVNLFLNTH